MSDDLILAALARLEAGQERLDTGLTSLRTDLSRLGAGQTNIHGDLTRLEAGQTDIRGDLTRLEAGQTDLRTDLSRLEAGQARLDAGQTSLRTDLMARMDRLQDSLTAIRDDVATNMGAVDAMQRANDNTRDLSARKASKCRPCGGN